MTDAQSQSVPGGIPAWVSVVVILLCLAGGVGFVWWFVSGSGSPTLADVKLKPTIPPAVLKAFSEAATAGDAATIEQLLTKHPTLPNERIRDAGNSTLLHWAAWESQPTAATLLLDKGADINARDGEHDGTPLDWAIVGGRPGMVNALLARGARLDDDKLGTAMAGLNGAFDFGPGTREDRQQIVEILHARGLKFPEPGEAGFRFALQDKPGLYGSSEPAPIDAAKLPADAPPLLRQMLVVGAKAEAGDDGVVIRSEHHHTGIVTPTAYELPVRIRAKVKTDTTNIRLYYAAGSVILNWEGNPDQLRFHDPKTSKGEGIDDQGRVEPNVFHDVEWVLTPTSVDLRVDGQSRFRREGDFAVAPGRVGIGPAWGSTVTVKAIEVDKPE